MTERQDVGGRTKGKGQQGGWGTSSWLEMMLSGLAALPLGSLQVGWVEEPPYSTSQAILDLSWVKGRKEDGEEVRQQQLAVRCRQLSDSRVSSSIHFPFLSFLGCLGGVLFFYFLAPPES